MSIYVDIEKDFGSFQLKAKFEAGNETLALLGASGCGKSMTLRCIAGIITPDRGKIILDGVTLFDSEKRINLPPQKRHVGLMFQNYALFPNMTVLQNIKAGAKREKDSKIREDMIQSTLEQFDLKDLTDRYPHQLSGGQQQRVALARILVSNPGILLLDEPFSALDSHLRFKLEQEVRRVIRQFGKTVLLVSHDRDEVYRMSDSVAVMDNGEIQVIGSRSQVFRNPTTRKAAVLTGCKNISSIERLKDGYVRAVDWNMELFLPELPPEITAVGVRMKIIRSGSGENQCCCRVAEVIENPFSYTVLLQNAQEPAPVPLGWELLKQDWEAMEAPELTIHIPHEAILLLRD